MNADTTDQPDSIGLIRAPVGNPLSFEWCVRRFESLGWNRHRPA